ncbi:MAG: AAA family ATPase [Bacteroidota bacterium]
MESKKTLNDSFYTHIEMNEVNKVLSDENTLEILESVRINPLDELPPPPVCLRIEQNGEYSTIGTLGNFSLIIGKAKSRKTFFINIALATATKNDLVLNRFRGILPKEQSEVIYFDTEQGKHHVLKAVKRVCNMSSNNVPDNLKAYGLRKFKPSERLKLIEKAIYSNDKLSFVVIDGIRDLVTSINDEEQATMLTSKLLKWTEEQNIHIMCVLHQNKGDNNARGHLGSEVTNKAETVLSITKDENNKDISIVEAEFCRDKEPDAFAFSIDEFGIPFLIEDWEMKKQANQKVEKILPSNFPNSKHYEILDKIFLIEPELTYSEFCSGIQAGFGKFNISIGENKAKMFVKHYSQNGFVEMKPKQKNNKTIYKLVSPLS